MAERGRVLQKKGKVVVFKAKGQEGKSDGVGERRRDSHLCIHELTLYIASLRLYTVIYCMCSRERMLDLYLVSCS